MKEEKIMSKDEVLQRLDQLRLFDISNYIETLEDGSQHFNLEKMKTEGSAPLISLKHLKGGVQKFTFSNGQSISFQGTGEVVKVKLKKR